jgi:hypothetical protein
MSLRTKTTLITALLVMSMGLFMTFVRNYPLIFTQTVLIMGGIVGISWLWMTIYNILKSKSK